MLKPTRRRAGREMSITFALRRGRLIVRPRGEIDVATADHLYTAVLEAVDGDAGVVVDMDDVSFLDSAGVKALLACEAALAPSGIDFKVRNAGNDVRYVLEITNALHLLETDRPRPNGWRGWVDIGSGV